MTNSPNTTGQSVIEIVKELQGFKCKCHEYDLEACSLCEEITKQFPAIAHALIQAEEALQFAIKDLQLADTTVGKADLGSRAQTKACMNSASYIMLEALAALHSPLP